MRPRSLSRACPDSSSLSQTPRHRSSQACCLALATFLTACGGGTDTSADQTPTIATSSPPGPQSANDAELAEARAFRTSLADFVRELGNVPGALSADKSFALAGGAPRPPTSGGDTRPSPAPTIPAPLTGAPLIDNSKLAAPAGGLSDLRVQSTSESAPRGGGEFRTSCAFSHMSYDDPIVYPGQSGRSHLHTFFGNTKVTAASTAESIRTSGNSTCRGGIANRSAYWVPTMIDTKDGTPLVPAGIGVYYKSGAVDGSLVQPIPAGLRMIAGDPGASGPRQEFSSRFKCLGGPNNQNNLYGPAIGNCDAGAELWQEIFFPACWDGRNLDSPDHKSHMSYYAHNTTVGYHCPPSHPVALPNITFNVIYAVPEKDAALRWRLASDTYDKSLPGGYSSHGDWFNGWIGEVSDAWARSCVQAKKDCHSHLLGDGREIY